MLCAVGLTVASYLAYVETRQVKAVCGPVGDCNAVQQSEYALLFGVLPVAVLGVIGYVAILAAWAWGRLGSGRLTELAPLALFGMALLGTLFSIYLTFLEPFVVGATCSWCLTSAMMMTLILLLVTEQGCTALCAGACVTIGSDRTAHLTASVSGEGVPSTMVVDPALGNAGRGTLTSLDQTGTKHGGQRNER